MESACSTARLGPDEVLLFCAEVPTLSQAMITCLSARLSRREQERAARFFFERDRGVFVVAHALLRHALGLVLEDGPIRFRTNAHGKPELDLERDDALHFNLSHTNGMAACAICRDHPIGLDVEEIDRKIDMENLAQQQFAASEHALIADAPPQHRAELFFRFWTLKEAILKALGVGLIVPLQEFAFALDPVTSKMRLARAEIACEWQIYEYSPSAHHRLAIAVHKSPQRPVKLISHSVPIEKLAEFMPIQQPKARLTEQPVRRPLCSPIIGAEPKGR